MGLKERAEEAYINENTPTASQIRQVERMQKRYEKQLKQYWKSYHKAAAHYCKILDCEYKHVERRHFAGQYRNIIQLWDDGNRVIDCVLIRKKNGLRYHWELYSLVDCYRCGPSDQLLGSRITSLASLHFALVNRLASREECAVVD
jgi:hypothetical protein